MEYYAVSVVLSDIYRCNVQKMGQQHGHKAVLEDDAVLNDAPLRARLKHVAARHGVVVHSGTVKACSLAVELYLRRVLQDMIRMHEIRNGQAKDVPGMVRDLQRNWARNVCSFWISAVCAFTFHVVRFPNRVFAAGGYHC